MQIKQLTWQQVLPVRHQVLWPNKDIEFCHVDGDDKAKHYGGFVMGKLVSVASTYADPDTNSVRLRKFATLVVYQGQGIGGQLLAHIVAQVKQTSSAVFWCDARTSAISLYAKFGMEVEGDEFIKSGLGYVKMSTKLS